MEALWSAERFPSIVHGEHRSERTDVRSAHVDDERKVVGLTVSLDFDACKVGVTTNEAGTQTLVIEKVTGERGEQGLCLLYTSPSPRD